MHEGSIIATEYALPTRKHWDSALLESKRVDQAQLIVQAYIENP